MKEGLERFASIVKRRREELGLRQDQLRDLGGPSTTTMTKVENAMDAPSPVTLRKLDAGLDWEPGSAARTLKGGDPTPIQGDASYLTNGEDIGVLLFALMSESDQLLDYLKEHGGNDEVRQLALNVDAAAQSVAVHLLGGPEGLAERAAALDKSIGRREPPEGRDQRGALAQVLGVLLALRMPFDGKARPSVSLRIPHVEDGGVGVSTVESNTEQPRADEVIDNDQPRTADDYDLVGRDVGGPSETEMIRRQMDADAERGDM